MSQGSDSGEFFQKLEVNSDYTAAQIEAKGIVPGSATIVVSPL